MSDDKQDSKVTLKFYVCKALQVTVNDLIISWLSKTEQN